MSTKMKMLIAISAGAMFGLLCFLPIVTEAQSYMTSDSETCINCHNMRPQFISKQRSRHKNAECADCHIPHDNIVKYYAYKSRDGMWDTMVYTVKQEDYAITLHEGSKITIRDNCIRCHPLAMQYVGMFNKTGRFCGDCHRNIVHGKRKGMWSYNYTHYPKFKPISSKLRSEE